MAEPADNAGGGAPSDNTSILRHLVARSAEDAALGPIWDPVAVRLCFDAGLGATFPLRFGGKTGPASGAPIDAMVEVIGLARDCWQSFGPTQVPLGDCAAIRVGGVEIVLITKRTQALGLELFTNLGIDPRAQEAGGRQVDQPLHGGVRADRQEGPLRRQRRAPVAATIARSLIAGAATDLAARPGHHAGPDRLGAGRATPEVAPQERAGVAKRLTPFLQARIPQVPGMDHVGPDLERHEHAFVPAAAAKRTASSSNVSAEPTWMSVGGRPSRSAKRTEKRGSLRSMPAGT